MWQSDLLFFQESVSFKSFNVQFLSFTSIFPNSYLQNVQLFKFLAKILKNLEQFQIHGKIRVESRGPIKPCLCPGTVSLAIDGSYQNPFVKIKPTLTGHSHPKSIVYIKVHSLCCTVYIFWQIYTDMYSLLQYLQKFYCPKNPLCSLPIHPSLPQQPLFTNSRVLPIPEWHKVGIIKYVALPDRLLLLSI